MDSWIDETLRQWRERADALEPYAPHAARAIRDCATELEGRAIAWQDERITLNQAAEERDYSRGHLKRLVDDGRLDADDNGRVRRGDLPKKANGKCNGETPVDDILRRKAIKS